MQKSCVTVVKKIICTAEISTEAAIAFADMSPALTDNMFSGIPSIRFVFCAAEAEPEPEHKANVTKKLAANTRYSATAKAFDTAQSARKM